jgi:outer membrane protein assembly factor BamB
MRTAGVALAALWLAATAPAGLITFEESARLDKPPGADWGRGLAYLNGHLYFGDNTTIYEMDPVSGAVISSFSPGVGFILGMAADEASGLLYVTQCCDDVVFRVDPVKQTVVSKYTVGTTNMQGLAIRDDKLYAASNDSYRVFEFDLASGATLRSFAVDSYLPSFGNVQGVEVFGGNVFANLDDGATYLEVHQFSLADFSHVGISYTGKRAAASTYDGQYFWLDEEGVGPQGLIKFKVIPEPATAALLLLGLGLLRRR